MSEQTFKEWVRHKEDVIEKMVNIFLGKDQKNLKILLDLV